MAQLALGLAGAAVGSMFGMPGVGFAVGAALGGYLTQPDAPDGPRLNDKKLQNSQYGQMLPIVYGRERLSGTVIDQTDLVEHAHHSSGKGQSGPTSYTYTASCDVAICDGPILGVLRIWADGRLIYDVTGATDVDNSKLPLTIYLGTETQDIDPTFEAIHGVGNVSAYLGTAHVVFTDWELGEFYNRIPNLEFEVYTAGGGIPWRVSSFVPDIVADDNNIHGGAVLEDGLIVMGRYVSGGTSLTTYIENSYDVYGTLVEERVNASFHNMDEVASVDINHCLNHPGIARMRRGGAGNDDTARWVVGAALGGLVQAPFGTDDHHCVFQDFIFHKDFVYVLGGSGSGVGYVSKYPAPGGIPSVTPVAYSLLPQGGGYSWQYTITAGNDDKIYVIRRGGVEGGPASPQAMYRFDLDLTEEHFWDGVPVEVPSDGYPFVVYNGMLLQALVETAPVISRYALYTIGIDDSFTEIGNVEIPLLSGGQLIDLGNGLVLTCDGVLSLNPLGAKIPLYAIVDDLCSRGELDASQYDTSELVDQVTGFKLTRQGTLRSAIETLVPAYAFSGVERDTLVAFPKRGRTPTITIPAGDLAATDYGSEQPAVRDYSHGHGDHLPRQVTVVYEEETADYQPGSQGAQRTVGDANSPVSMEFAIAMTAPEARAIAERTLLQAHVERDAFSGTTSRKYLYLEPTDVVTLVDRTVLLTEKEHTPAGLLSWKSVANVPQIYTGTNTGTVTGSAGSGFQQPVAIPRQLTELVLLDIASGTPFGFTAAMGKTSADGGSWPGATLYKSLDGGINWTEIASTAVPNIIGAATSVLAYFPGPIDNIVIDNVSTVTIQLTDVSLQLSSVNLVALTNGANLCALRSGGGWEILQFQNATLVAPGQYTLTNFYRARRETAAFMGTHAVGDDFVMLPAIPVDAPEHEINVELLYKAVTSGMTLAETPQQAFTNTGVSSTDYFDTIIDHLPVFSGGDSSGGDSGPGVVPAPEPGDCDAGKFLSACGTWEVPGGSSSGGFVPTYLAPGETFTVPADRQALFAVTIVNDGILDVAGMLIEVD